MPSPELALYMGGAAFNLLIAFSIARLIYYPATQERQYVLTFVTFSTITYFVLGLLKDAEVGVGLGVGFGLFAIFSILRFRADEMPAREMTYLFVFIGLAIINSLLVPDRAFAQILLYNALVIVVLFVLERGWGFGNEQSQRVIYDRIELVQPARRQELLADLKQRTGLDVTAVEVRRIDLLRDTAELQVTYKD
jgi:hypothetical protein